MDKKEKAQEWYKHFEPLLGDLPSPENPLWDETERQLWLNAFTSVLDLYVRVKGDENYMPF